MGRAGGWPVDSASARREAETSGRIRRDDPPVLWGHHQVFSRNRRAIESRFEKKRLVIVLTSSHYCRRVHHITVAHATNDKRIPRLATKFRFQDFGRIRLKSLQGRTDISGGLCSKAGLGRGSCTGSNKLEQNVPARTTPGSIESDMHEHDDRTAKQAQWRCSSDTLVTGLG